MLRVDKITKNFDGVRAVDGLSFEVPKGSITALIGPNGSGKTTVFNLITGFLRPDAGSIHINGKKTAGLAPHRIFHLGVGRTFQNIRLFPQMTALENVLLGLSYEKGETFTAAVMKSKAMLREEKENIQKAEGLLETVGLSGKRDELAETLSHGQRRLLEIARTLGTDSGLYLFDEPTAGVFPNTIPKLLGIIEGMKANGKSILFIEHNMKVVMEISDRIIVLDQGAKIAEGTPEEIQKNEAVLDAYMGKRRGEIDH